MTQPAFWVVVVFLVGTSVLHYLTPQIRQLPPPMDAFLHRHAVERILFVLPVALATFFAGWRAGALTLALAVLAMLPRAIWISPSTADALLETLAVALVGYLVIWAIEIQSREKTLRQLYARQITRAQEEERKRIARELHDETIQTLIAVSRRLEMAAACTEPLPEGARQDLEIAQGLIGRTSQGLRRFIQDLRPSTLDLLGFVPAIEGLIDALSERDGIEADLELDGEIRRLGPEEELALFRIAQEALNNVSRHAQASTVNVKLVFHLARVQMTIADDGRGFSVPRQIGDLVPRGKLGLIGMQERARGLGGTLSVRSQPGRGTTITVQLPLLGHEPPASDDRG